MIDLRPGLTLLLDRVVEDVFEITIVGRVSSGKSSLLNALSARPAAMIEGRLPVDVGTVMLTAVTFASTNGAWETVSVLIDEL